MATTRSILRSDAPRLLSPGKVLERANELLVPDIPAQMFVTCLYGVLDPATGRLEFANAGHNVPYVATQGGVVELRARGMPLGLMQGMTYEEKEAQLGAGETILLHSDGLAEAHDPRGEMFGFPRLMKIMEGSSGERVIDVLLTELARFTGATWEQEDDITLVTLERARSVATDFADPHAGAPRTLADFSIASEPGNERVVMERVTDAVTELSLPSRRLEQLQTAVSEAAMNAIEHGNRNDPDLEVHVSVATTQEELSIQITDQGGERPIPEPEEPDIEAKLAGLQKARGWGLFLIQNMVDDMRTTSDEHHHTIELIVHLKGADDGS
jgi:anti-sigma regulatory factor (Ser/Thr protein kinase)